MFHAEKKGERLNNRFMLPLCLALSALGQHCSLLKRFFICCLSLSIARQGAVMTVENNHFLIKILMCLLYSYYSSGPKVTAIKPNMENKNVQLRFNNLLLLFYYLYLVALIIPSGYQGPNI